MSIQLGQNLVSPIGALLRGASSVIINSKLRSLAVKPWLFGFVSWIILVIIGFSFHSFLAESFIGQNPKSWLAILGWLGVSIGIVISASLLSFGIVMIGASIYQTDIARTIFEGRGESLPPPFGITKSVITETIKFLILLPLIIICFVLGLIPILTPFAFVLGSWLIAVQFLDTALDAASISPRKRLAIFLTQPLRTIVFGIPFALLVCIPFVAFLLPPFAVAAAAELAIFDQKKTAGS